jgi:hypothetical protein
MNIINFKKFEGIFDLVCVVECLMNLHFYEKKKWLIIEVIITVLKYVNNF